MEGGDSSPVPMLMKKKRKRPKLDHVEGRDNTSSPTGGGAEEDDIEEQEAAAAAEVEVTLQEQEEALVTLIDYRSKEVDHLRKRTNYYRSQLGEAERNLNGLHSKLARLRSKSSTKLPPKASADTKFIVKQERTSASPVVSHSQPHSQSKPQLLIPAVKPKVIPAPAASLQAVKLESSSGKTAAAVGDTPPTSSISDTIGRLKQKRSSDRPTADKEAPRSRSAAKKKPAGNIESKDLIPSIRTCSSPSIFRVQSSTHIGSHHNRRLRSLELNPTNDQLFCTSALDGVVNLWELQSNGSAASLLSATNCGSLKGRWPEDIVWHPDGDRLFATYTADGGDSQISILNLNASRDNRVTYLEGKPHLRGIINNIEFMPWTDLSFATGGSDHAVTLWHEKDNGSSWKPEVAHKNLHSSAVTGVAGLQQKKMVLSVGADKRIIGFDLLTSRADFKHQIESKCMSVLLNPFDFNLFVVQTGAPGKQLRLFDIRLRQTEIHSFGWKQESSESQSALINQSWSSDGFSLSSGSADPMIHIFDIRYNCRTPSQSVQAHQKRVFKAAWHRSFPLLISISSDLNVGLHRVQ